MKKRYILSMAVLVILLTLPLLTATPALACFYGTTVNIIGPTAPVPAGSQVTLIVTESNDSIPEYPDQGEITDVVVYLTPGVYELSIANLYSGDDGNGVLDPGETWTWHVSLTVSADTLFTAIGHGYAEGNPEWDITYGIYDGQGNMAYPNEKFELFVDTTGNGFGTKGYWHNKNGLNELKNDPGFSTLLAYINGLDPYDSPSGYFNNGREPFDGLDKHGHAVPPAIKKLTGYGAVLNEISQFLVDPNAGGGGGDREQLAQQLLAFIFNVNYRIGNFGASIELPDSSLMTGQEIIDAAVTAWASPGTSDDVQWEQILDSLNNNY